MRIGAAARSGKIGGPVGAVLLVVVLAACGGGRTVGGQEQVTVSDLQEPAYFYEGEHLGQIVTVTAAVAVVRDPRTFELSGGDPRDVTTTVLTREPVMLSPGQLVQVTGRMGQLHTSAPSERVPYIQDSLYSTAHTEAYLYDATVGPRPR